MSNRNREGEMSMKTEQDLDMALAALAREIAPQPGRELGEAVLADAALATFAREVRAATPLPRPELVARVLGDAAEIGAGFATGHASAAAVPQRRALARAKPGLLERLFGWQVGAVAVMMLALGLGVGVGLEIEPEAMPLLEKGAQEAPIALAALDGGFIGSGLMGFDGL